MADFIIYDEATGAIRGAYKVSHASDIASVMTANTPAGASAMAVDSSHPVTTDQRGWQVQDGAVTALVPSDAQLLAQAKAAQLAILTASYNLAKTTNVTYLGTAFMADADSQELFAHALTAYTALDSTPSDFYAVDSNYAKVPMNLDQLKGLIEAISTQVWAAFQRWVSVKESLASATTVADVQSISW